MLIDCDPPTDPPMVATLVFPCRRDQVMLATKMSGPGLGYLNGWGGKKKPDEEVLDCALREFTEETGGARISDLSLKMDRFRNVGVVHISKLVGKDSIPVMEVFVYVVGRLDVVGNIESTHEMRKPGFHSVHNIQRLHLLPGDKYWLPHFLARDDKGAFRRNMHAWVEYLPGLVGLASEPVVISNDENDSWEDDLLRDPYVEF